MSAKKLCYFVAKPLKINARIPNINLILAIQVILEPNIPFHGNPSNNMPISLKYQIYVENTFNKRLILQKYLQWNTDIAEVLALH